MAATVGPSSVPVVTREVALGDRWDEHAGSAFMTGVHALIRALLDQRRADRRAGLRTGGFVSGYQGSPLGGVDRELARLHRELAELGIHFQPGLNEELAATSVWGSQLAHLTPGATVDGVLGLWYGKGPGLDRASDPIRHANLSGVDRLGGAVLAVGDDPAAKSSTVPSAAERSLSGLLVPVLAPSSVQEVLEYGQHAFRLSRAAGLWAALKIVSDLADASATVRLDVTLPDVERLVDLTPTAHLLAASTLEPERHLHDVRLPAALEYARRAGLNRIVGSAGARARYGIVAAGATYAELQRSLHELALDEPALERVGVRILKVGMVWPLDAAIVREFADGLETVLVVEDKLGFLEDEVRAALYGSSSSPAVIGKHDAAGARLLRSHGSLDADDVSRALARLLHAERATLPEVDRRLARLDTATRGLLELPVARTPYFCSGCPHNTSTQAPHDALVGAGIGCHTMVLLAGPDAGDVLGLTQMGGEGAQWIGMAAFTDRPHLTQNIGDGTFHHSGSLAVRAAVASGVSITYKLLYNEAVAMTGGQAIEGVMGVPELTRMLEAEGVKRIVVTAEDPARYRGVRLAGNASVRSRDDLQEAAAELAAIEGVTVLIHDQQCAAEKRRMRKRGTLPAAKERVWINERVCEGCGDCGEQSSCLSVMPVETELGRKTQIHQASCNVDLSCLKGDCPSFVTVRAPVAAERVVPAAPPVADPDVAIDRDVTIRMVGMGGTGVVTVAQILAMAAQLQGTAAGGLDQTGLSQKGGPVVSDLRLAPVEPAGSPRASAASVDVLLAFDLLTAAEPAMLRALGADRTVAVVSDSLVPTGAMVRDVRVVAPEPPALLAQVASQAAAMPVVVDAQALSERLFGDHMPANLLLVGAAWQLGLLPLGWDALARAVEMNGAGAETNLAALRWGRAVVAARPAVDALLGGAAPAPAEPPAWLAARVAALSLPSGNAGAPASGAGALASDAAPSAGDGGAPSAADGAVPSAGNGVAPSAADGAVPSAGGDVRDLVLRRATDLLGWGGRRAVVARYLDAVGEVAAIEAERTPGRGEITVAVAQSLHKLLAYKDEYEVARLHLLPEERARREAEFGAGARFWMHLHPPFLRALGMTRKIRLGRWALPLMYALRAGRRLRGTPLDVFGYADVRRLERALPGEYLEVVRTALARLDEADHEPVAALCALPDMIRGYEQIKLANVERWRAASREALAALA